MDRFINIDKPPVIVGRCLVCKEEIQQGDEKGCDKEALKLVEGDQPENKYVYDLVLRKGIIEGDVITKLNIYQRQYPKYG